MYVSNTYNFGSLKNKNPYVIRNIRKDRVDITNKAIKSQSVKKPLINIPILISTGIGLLASFAISKKLNLKNELLNTLFIGAGSIIGGLAGGFITGRNKNKSNMLKEANFQILNMTIPVVLIDILLKKANEWFPRNKSKIKNNVAIVAATGAGILAGATIAEGLSNTVNNRFLTKDFKYDRKLQTKDVLTYTDDIAVSTSLFKIPVMKLLVPLAFLSCGYQAGVKE